MYKIVLLDAGPLSLVIHPKGKDRARKCNLWLQSLLSNGVRVCIPEIADYEVRRELIRIGSTNSIQKLDTLNNNLEYIPISTVAMRKAAHFWAQARKSGRKTADDKALDADMILIAQATMSGYGNDTVIATTNVGHLSLFAKAEEWENITP